MHLNKCNEWCSITSMTTLSKAARPELNHEERIDQYRLTDNLQNWPVIFKVVKVMKVR